MAAPATPSIWSTAETVRLSGAYVVARSAPTAGVVETNWQLSRTDAFPATADDLIWESKLREPDDRRAGEQWLELPVELLDVEPGLVAYLSCNDRNGSLEESAFATALAVTFEAAKLSQARYLVAQ